MSFQASKTWKQSSDPDFETQKNRILELYAFADGTAAPKQDDPTVVICMDEFGPLNFQPFTPPSRPSAREASCHP